MWSTRPHRSCSEVSRRRSLFQILLFFIFASNTGWLVGAEPTVASISPTSGSSLGGTRLTVSGSDFTVGSTSYHCLLACGSNVLSTPAAQTTSSTSLECTLPMWVWGACTADMTVRNGTTAIAGGPKSFEWTAAWTALSQVLMPLLHTSTSLPRQEFTACMLPVISLPHLLLARKPCGHFRISTCGNRGDGWGGILGADGVSSLGFRVWIGSDVASLPGPQTERQEREPPSHSPNLPSPQAYASISGGTSIELVGAGFSSSRSYKCTFAEVNAGYAPKEESAIYFSASKIVCTTPAFPAAGTVILSVQASDGTGGWVGVPKVPAFNNRVDITLDGWSSVEPASALASRAFNMTVIGEGFVTAGAYTAEFQAGANTLTAACNRTGGTRLLCMVAAWPYGEASASLKILRGGVEVGKTFGGAVTVTFVASWSTVSSRTFSLSGPVLGGTNLTLYGSGFVAGVGGYGCRFSGTKGGLAQV